MNFGRKGKLMLGIFMISGMLVAFATINMYSILTKDYRDLLTMDERYIQVEKNPFYQSSGGATGLLNKVNSETSGDYLIYMDRLTVNSQLGIDLGNGSFKYLPSFVKVEYSNQLKPK